MNEEKKKSNKKSEQEKWFTSKEMNKNQATE